MIVQFKKMIIFLAILYGTIQTGSISDISALEIYLLSELGNTVRVVNGTATSYTSGFYLVTELGNTVRIVNGTATSYTSGFYLVTELGNTVMVRQLYSNTQKFLYMVF